MASSCELLNEISSAYALPHQDMNEPFFNVSERQPSLLQDQIMEGLKNPACRLLVTPEQQERFEPVTNDSIGFLALITRGSICK